MRVVLITAPPDVANDLARRLVDEGRAACVNVVPGATSHYRWEGALHADAESLLIAKVAAERVGALIARAVELHPYDNPEAIALDVTDASPAYRDWVRSAGGPSAG